MDAVSAMLNLPASSPVPRTNEVVSPSVGSLSRRHSRTHSAGVVTTSAKVARARRSSPASVVHVSDHDASPVRCRCSSSRRSPASAHLGYRRPGLWPGTGDGDHDTVTMWAIVSKSRAVFLGHQSGPWPSQWRRPSTFGVPVRSACRSTRRRLRPRPQPGFQWPAQPSCSPLHVLVPHLIWTSVHVRVLVIGNGGVVLPPERLHCVFRHDHRALAGTLFVGVARRCPQVGANVAVNRRVGVSTSPCRCRRKRRSCCVALAHCHLRSDMPSSGSECVAVSANCRLRLQRRQRHLPGSSTLVTSTIPSSCAATLSVASSLWLGRVTECMLSVPAISKLGDFLKLSTPPSMEKSSSRRRPTFSVQEVIAAPPDPPPCTSPPGPSRSRRSSAVASPVTIRRFVHVGDRDGHHDAGAGAEGVLGSDRHHVGVLRLVKSSFVPAATSI